MKKERRVAMALVLAIAFCFSMVSVTQAGGRINTKPLWKITEDRTNMSVTWKRYRPNPRFQIYDAGTPEDESDDLVLDMETGLVWERCPDRHTGKFYADTWEWACFHCYDMELGGRKGWRLPTLEELLSLVDTRRSFPCLPPDHPFSDIPAKSKYVWWSSTSFVNDTGQAWTVEFDEGDVGKDKKGNYNFVWCVRGGQGHDAVFTGAVP